MSNQTFTPERHRGFVRTMAYFMIAFGALAVQIGLPSISYYCFNEEKAWKYQDPRFDPHSNGKTFWRMRFSFYRFFHPIERQFADGLGFASFESAAVCGDELIALFLRNKQPASWRMSSAEEPDSFELVRCDLRSGKVTVSKAPSEIRYVLSDGKTLWQLPRYAHSLMPFVWNGKPTALASCQRDRTLSQLIEFSDGRWVETEQFAILPDSFDVDGEPQIRIHQSNGRLLLCVGTQANFCYRTSLEVGTEAEAKTYIQSRPTYINQMGVDDLRELGWQVDHASLSNSLGYWFENNQPCTFIPGSVQMSMLVAGAPRFVTKNGYFCHCADDKLGNEDLVESPIRWANQKVHRSCYCLVGGMDVRLHILSFDRGDGRLSVMSFSDRKIRLIGQTSLANVWPVCRDGGLLFALITIIPMFGYVIVAWLIHRRDQRGSYAYGLETVTIASIVRRATARTIDLLIVGPVVVAAVITHPDMLAWLDVVMNSASTSRNRLVDWSNVSSVVQTIQSLLVTLVSIPYSPGLFFTGIAILVAQLVWQGRSGRTVGKWLTGIRVVRTTLRPCGLARSLLREIVIIVDGVLLLSWIPGILSILMTDHAQRLGDRMADTLVVRDVIEKPKAATAGA